ncbi:HEPN domain-containing protein [Candidatus Gottesmanbacteria bacterium]|nr:HEPN domain-containing protein [Candidatus Gottesmanbacteria bacterium]
MEAALSPSKPPKKPSKPTYFLRPLIDSCANFDKDFLSFRSKIAKLSFYYVQVRYPDIGDVDSYTQEEANEAYQLSIELVEFVGKKIKKTR